MSPELIGILGVGITGAVFLWNIQRDVSGIHRDIADLRERMAKLEGLFEGFVRRPEAET